MPWTFGDPTLKTKDIICLMLRYWKGLKLYQTVCKEEEKKNKTDSEEKRRLERKWRARILKKVTQAAFGNWTTTAGICSRNSTGELLRRLLGENSWPHWRAMKHTMGVSAEKAQGESGVSSVENIQSLKVWMATHLGSVHTVRQTAMLHLGSSAALSNLFRLKENITTAVHSIHILALKATLRSCWVVRKWVWSWAHCWGQLARSMWINQD